MVVPLPVLEPEKQTTDPVLLSVLKKSKIDSRFVEFMATELIFYPFCLVRD